MQSRRTQLDRFIVGILPGESDGIQSFIIPLESTHKNQAVEDNLSKEVYKTGGNDSKKVKGQRSWWVRVE